MQKKTAMDEICLGALFTMKSLNRRSELGYLLNSLANNTVIMKFRKVLRL